METNWYFTKIHSCVNLHSLSDEFDITEVDAQKHQELPRVIGNAFFWRFYEACRSFMKNLGYDNKPKDYCDFDSTPTLCRIEEMMLCR